MLQPAKYAKLRIIWIKGSKILRIAVSYQLFHGSLGEKKDEDTQQPTRGVEVSFKGQQCHDPIISDRFPRGTICTAGRATRKDAWL